MFRMLLPMILILGMTTPCISDDTFPRKTSLKVYPVGNIVSAAAMKARVIGRTTNDEWASEYVETRNALGEIKELIETLSREKPESVAIYAPSLSLIIRQSEEGHKEIEELLNQLGGVTDDLIEMEYRPVVTEGSEEINAGFASLTEVEQRRLVILNAKPRLTKAETAELNAFMTRLSVLEWTKDSVLLKPGQRAQWGSQMWPTTAMARVDHQKKTVDIRIDAISDDFGELTPVSTHLLTLAEGESAHIMYPCDGHISKWLITAKLVKPRVGADSVSFPGNADPATLVTGTPHAPARSRLSSIRHRGSVRLFQCTSER